MHCSAGNRRQSAMPALLPSLAGCHLPILAEQCHSPCSWCHQQTEGNDRQAGCSPGLHWVVHRLWSSPVLPPTRPSLFCAAQCPPRMWSPRSRRATSRCWTTRRPPSRTASCCARSRSAAMPTARVGGRHWAHARAQGTRSCAGRHAPPLRTGSAGFFVDSNVSKCMLTSLRTEALNTGVSEATASLLTELGALLMLCVACHPTWALPCLCPLATPCRPQEGA